MENVTNSRSFRENLSFFFDKAADEPVAINRKNDRFVLMSEGDFLKMQQEISNLQKSLISSLQIQSSDDNLEEDLDLEEDSDSLIDEYVEKYQAKKNHCWSTSCRN